MRHLFSVFVLFLFATTTIAAPAIDQSNIIAQSTGSTIIFAGNAPAQTFTANSSGLLSQIDVLLRRDAGDIGTLALELWPVVGGGPAGNTPLYSVPINPNSVTTASTAALVPIDLSAGGIYVVPGEQYAIALNGTANISGPRALWTGGLPDYSTGARFSRSGAWEIGSSSSDYGFRTWVDSALTPAGMQILQLNPTSEWSASLSTGGGSVISTAGDTMRVDRTPSIDQDRRGLMEFNAALPPGAKLRTAKLGFEINQRSQSGSTFPIVAAYGYQADGSPSDADARGLTNLLGQSGQIQNFDPININLDVAKVTSMIQTSPGVGITAYQAVTNMGVNIVGSQLANQSSSYSRPKLSLGYTVPSYPAQSWPAGDYNHDAKVDAADYPIWRKANGTIGASPADGDHDNDVDQNDHNIWKAAYGKPVLDQQVRNGGFTTGTLSDWTVVVEANTDVTAGFPKVESFDVDGDGQSNSAMRVRLGRSNTDLFGGTVALEQQLLLGAGSYVFSANVAAQSLQSTANTGPGNFELTFDGKVVDQALLNGTTIAGFAVLRDTLNATLINVQPGYHTLRLAVSRGGTNTREIYQFIDNIQFTPVIFGSGASIPEPTTGSLLIVALGLAACRRYRFHG